MDKPKSTRVKKINIINIVYNKNKNYSVQHEADVTHKWISNCAAEKHVDKTGHNIQFENSKVLAHINKYRWRPVGEPTEIRKTQNNFTREDGYKLPSA